MLEINTLLCSELVFLNGSTQLTRKRESTFEPVAFPDLAHTCQGSK